MIHVIGFEVGVDKEAVMKWLDLELWLARVLIEHGRYRLGHLQRGARSH